MNFLTKTPPALFLLFALSLSHVKAQEAKWINLLDDASLSQFKQLNGTADFTLKDGVLIGTSKRNTPNSFLATKKTYADFILEFEVQIDLGSTPAFSLGAKAKKTTSTAVFTATNAK